VHARLAVTGHLVMSSMSCHFLQTKACCFSGHPDLQFVTGN